MMSNLGCALEGGDGDVAKLFDFLVAVGEGVLTLDGFLVGLDGGTGWCPKTGAMSAGTRSVATRA